MSVRVAMLVREIFSFELPFPTCVLGAEDMAARAFT